MRKSGPNESADVLAAVMFKIQCVGVDSENGGKSTLCVFIRGADGERGCVEIDVVDVRAESQWINGQSNSERNRV